MLQNKNANSRELDEATPIHLLSHDWVNFTREGPHGKYCWRRGPSGLCRNYWALLLQEAAAVVTWKQWARLRLTNSFYENGE